MADRLEKAGIAVHSLDARRSTDAPRAVSRLLRLLNRLRPALLHTFLFHANIVGRLSAYLAGTSRVVSSVRVAEKRYRYHLVLENLTCRLSDKVVCVSDAVCRYTRRHSHVPAARLTAIANGIDSAADDSVPVDRSEMGVPPDATAALYVGRLDEQKGVDSLLHALAIAQSRDPRLHLVLAGSGPEQQSLIGLVRQLGVESRTHFLGWRADVLSLMRTTDFFVMPSRWEGMPNSVLEAMSVGLPVIATRAEGSTQLVRDGQTGMLVGIDRPAELAEAMLRLAGDATLRAQYGRNGQDVARREFSLAQMIERYSQLYESLLV
jgi:starch synthase (maltosyl-transferring)